MRKRKFGCGVFALCLALSVAGCGKSAEERQAADYYQNELGLDQEAAEELAHALYGEEDEAEPSSVTEEEPEEIAVVEPLPELVNSEWYDRKVQIYDMVFTRDECLTEEDIRSIVEGSAYDVELAEAFDEEGEVCLEGLMLDGKQIVRLVKAGRHSNDISSGTIEYGEYYHFENKQIDLENNWYDKAIMEVEALDFKTRDEVLAYLAENGFVEVEEEQAPYIRIGFDHRDRGMSKRNGRDYAAWYVNPYNDWSGIEYADVPHYYSKGAQSITFYRIHKISETDQEIKFGDLHYYGIHLNLVETVSVEFNTDGTVSSVSEPEVLRVFVTGEMIR